MRNARRRQSKMQPSNNTLKQNRHRRGGGWDARIRRGYRGFMERRVILLETTKTVKPTRKKTTGKLWFNTSKNLPRPFLGPPTCCLLEGFHPALRGSSAPTSRSFGCIIQNNREHVGGTAGVRAYLRAELVRNVRRNSTIETNNLLRSVTCWRYQESGLGVMIPSIL